MKKEETKKHLEDNSFGVASVVLGILSILFASINGIILGIIALVFANKQKNKSPNKWAKNGRILAIIGIILSILTIVVSIWLLRNNPTALRSLLQQ